MSGNERRLQNFERIWHIRQHARYCVRLSDCSWAVVSIYVPRKGFTFGTWPRHCRHRHAVLRARKLLLSFAILRITVSHDHLMRLNRNLALLGDKVVLVPYKPSHVAIYHEWCAGFSPGHSACQLRIPCRKIVRIMHDVTAGVGSQKSESTCHTAPSLYSSIVVGACRMQDPFLQEATASEPLTLEDEYAMQRSWAEDGDKLTFIILDKDFPDTPGTGHHGGAMAGDVNLFLNDPDDRSIAEIEIMVAEPASRRKGLACEALLSFMAYAVGTLGISKFVAKIGEGNEVSLRLFAQLGYTEVRRVAVFKEVHLELNVEGETKQRLSTSFGAMDWVNCDL